MNDDQEMCITADMDDWRTCTIAGEHQLACNLSDNWEWSDRANQWVLCKGCLPKTARYGYLCGACYTRAEQALTQWTVEAATLMASIDRAVVRDNAGIRTTADGHIPIPATRLAVDEIDRLLNSKVGKYPGRLDYWIATPAGAKNAVRLARAVTNALRSHELEEHPHDVKHIRCPDCDQLTLVWTPPWSRRSDVKIDCQNVECGHQFDQDTAEEETERQLHAIDEPVIEAGMPVTIDRNDAEQYSPAKPEHAGFDILTTYRVREIRALVVDDDGNNTLGMTVTAFGKLTKAQLIAAIREPELEEDIA